jgi:hypothetical protein
LGGTDVVVTAILQSFPRLKRWMAVIIVSLCAFLISIPFTCPVRIQYEETLELLSILLVFFNRVDPIYSHYL